MVGPIESKPAENTTVQTILPEAPGLSPMVDGKINPLTKGKRDE
jgi:hypothetical protein